MQAKRIKLRIVVGTTESCGESGRSGFLTPGRSCIVKLPVYRHLLLSLTHVRLYADLLAVLSGGTQCAQLWYLFLLHRMDAQGVVTHNGPQRWRFNLTLQQQGKSGYHEGAIKNATAELVRLDLIKSAYGRGRYFINPLHAWVGSEAARVLAIRRYLEDPTLTETKPKTP